MLKVRLAKTGKRNAPSYRVVVIPEERPRDGEAVEILGHFNPSVEPPSLKIDKKRLQYWLERGAQPTEAVEKLIKGEYKFKKYVAKAEKGKEKGEQEQPPDSAQTKQGDQQPAASDKEKEKQEAGGSSSADKAGKPEASEEQGK